jgi:hypothetical protein
MTHCPKRPLLLPLTFILLAAGWARGGEVEVAPFFGLQYGGALVAPSGGKVRIDVGPQYGATLDVAFAQRWSIELLYARQETEVASTPRIGLAVERYMAGAREEKEVGRGRFLGVALIGLTRVVPDGLGADERFTVAVGLGVRWPLTPRLGLRADARGYYAIVSSGSGTACLNGSCLLVFGSSGVWQGDITAGLTWTFGGQKAGPPPRQ